MENPAADIIRFNSYYQNLIDQGDRFKEGLSLKETAVLDEQARYNDSELAASCCRKLDLGMAYYSAIGHQIDSVQAAWAAVVREQIRYKTVGWQGGSRKFIKALHTCLYMIPIRMQIGILGPYPNTEEFLSGCDAGELSSKSGSIPIGLDDLPDFEDSQRSPARPPRKP